MEEQNTSEEEWEEMQRRFTVEGLDSVQLSSKQKSLYLWRWLVDAENNMVTSRKMLDKVREQHSNEIKEVETFVEHIQHLSGEKYEKLEDENAKLRQEADELRQKSVVHPSEEITKMITREGLNEIAQSTLEEQVAYLLVLRSRLMEELETERKRTKSLDSKLEEKKPQVSEQLLHAQSNYEQEMKHQLELTKQVKEELKNKHDMELKSLQSRLNVAQKKIQQLESGNNTKKTDRKIVDGDDSNDSGNNVYLQNKLSNAEDRVKKLQVVKRQLEIDNETLTFKISELLAECEEKEAQLRKERMINFGINSRRNSSESDLPRKIPNNLDNKELLEQQHLRKLQQDVEKLQEQLANVSCHHDALATRYHQRKMDGKTKMQRIKDVFQAKQTSLKDQICDLENSLTVVQTTLSWEKECRQKIQSDFAILQREKSELMKKILDCDDDLRDKSTLLKSLNMRATNLEEENAKICQEMAILKTIVLKDMLINSSLESKKECVSSSDWLNRLQHVSTARSQKVSQVRITTIKENEEVTV